jgi:DNA polymerase I-like protein with 3'-5' exonuclease and polymerase domains
MYKLYDDVVNEKGVRGTIAAFPQEGKVTILWNTPGKIKKTKSTRKLDPKKLLFWDERGDHSGLSRLRANDYQLEQIGAIPLDSRVVRVGSPEFQGAIAELKTCKEFGFDIETYGTEKQDHALHPWTGEIRLLQAYLPESDRVIVWDLGAIPDRLYELTTYPGGTGHFEGKYDSTLTPGLDVLLSKLSCDSTKVFIHNAAFEGIWINQKFGVEILNVVDTMLLSQVFWAGMVPGMQSVGMDNPNGLKWLCFRLGLGKPEKEDQKWDYGYAVGNRQLNYGANDARLTYKAGQILLTRGKRLGLQNAMQAELDAIPGFAQMRYLGMPVDNLKLEETIALYQGVINDLKSQWDEEYPEINPSSTKQSGGALTERLDVDLMRISPRTGELALSTAYDALSPYFERYPITRILADIGSLETSLKYLLTLKENVRKNVKGMDAVYGGFVQLATSGCGRSGCKGTDGWTQLQNPPKLKSPHKALGLTPVRDVFAPPPGYKLIALDLSGCHGQIARYMSQEPKLIEANELGLKFHYYTSQGILELQGIKLTPSQIMAIKKDSSHELHNLIDETYEFSKKAFYTWLNGGGGGSLQGSFLDADPPQFVERAVCDQLMKGTRSAYGTLRNFMYNLPKVANEKAHVIPVYLDDSGELVHWGKLDTPTPGLTEKFVGSDYGKYCGRLPGTIRIYGELRSLDGGRYFVQKYPNNFQDGKLMPELGDCTAFTWQRTEKTGICNAIAKITKHFRLNNNWDAWIACLLHDELVIIVREEYAKESAWYCFNTLTECMREWIKDYSNETKDPYLENVHDRWKK